MRDLHFTTPKAPGTVRIFLLGESAIQGFPQPVPLTDGSFLESMLRDAWRGERQVEVINLGATAVASFPVLCFLEEVLDYEPDLIVLMVGSNEYYGAYGVASLPAAARFPGGMRLTRWVRGLGLSQWLVSLRSHPETPGGALMEHLASKGQVPHDDPLREAAANSLRSNVGAMVRSCVARRVPIVVCTVPTNERGLAPIGDDPVTMMPPGESQPVGEELALGERLLVSDPERAVEHARTVIAVSPTHARAHFLLATALTRLGRHAEALEEYVRARDADRMPWRATSAARDAVVAAALQGGLLCDIEAAFRAESPGGAIGWELMDDHVHMSLRGQALFARTIASMLTAMPAPLQVDAQALEGLPNWEVYAERLGQSVYSDYGAAHHMRKLFEIGFMRRNNGAAFERSQALVADLRTRMTELDRTASDRWNDPELHGTSERPLEAVVGLYRLRAGDFAAAARLLRVARVSVPLLSLWRLELTWLLLTCHRHLHDQPTPEDLLLCEDAIRVGGILERFDPTRNADIAGYLGLAYNLAGNHGAAIERLEVAARTTGTVDRWDVARALADSYWQLGRVEDARRLLEGAAADPAMGEAAKRLLARMEDSTGGGALR